MGYLCVMKRKARNELPVYDICSLRSDGHRHADMIAERFADYLQRHPGLHRPHGHSFYHLVLFTKGGGTHAIDFRRYPVKAGQIYFMVPGQVHSWDFEGETDGFIVNFPEELFHTFFADPAYLDRFFFWEDAAEEHAIQLTSSDAGEAARILAQVTEEAAGDQVLRVERIRVLLLSLFILVARAGGSTPAKGKMGHNQVLLQHFRRLVNRHYHEYRLPKEYAAMLYITPNHLNALCQDLAGKPAGEVIRDRILLEAKRQLVNTDAAVSDIGYRLGFRDNSYFTKFFKRYTGTTPEEFKKGLDQPVP